MLSRITGYDHANQSGSDFRRLGAVGESALGKPTFSEDEMQSSPQPTPHRLGRAIADLLHNHASQVSVAIRLMCVLG